MARPQILAKKVYKSIKDVDRYRSFLLGLPIPIIVSHNVPWGYFRKPGDNKLYYPDEKALRLLHRVSILLRDYSYRDMAIWLAQAGYPITFRGLKKVIEERCPVDEINLPYEERLKLL